MSQTSFSKVCRTLVLERFLIVCLVLVLGCVALAQQAKSGPAKDMTGRYEGTAKNKAEEVITVAFELTEKDGALSGMIRSSHGDFPITGGTHKGDAVTIEFDAVGPGTITLHMTEGKLVGTWTAGEDGGPVDVKKAAAQEEPPKGKS